MSASTVIVAINARLLRLKAGPKPQGKAGPIANAKAEPTPEAKTEPTPEAKAEPKPEAKADIPQVPPNVAPQAVKRVHELYEELGREDVRAVQAWEDAQRESRKGEAKANPQSEGGANPRSGPKP
jgi:hypothetical protein